MRVDADAPVDLQWEQDLPTSLIWEEQVWQVIDRPTPLLDELEGLHPLITHAPDWPRQGWRFIARCVGSGEARTFDVMWRGQSWWVNNVWD